MQPVNKASDNDPAANSQVDANYFSETLSDDLRSTFLAVLKAHETTLIRCCRALDVQASGSLTRFEFIHAVNALLWALEEQDALHPNLGMAGAPHIEDLRGS